MSDSDFVTDGWLGIKEYTGNDTNVVIPERIWRICMDAFKDNTNIRVVTIPENVSTIELGAFYGCTGLTKVNFSEGLETIGYSAFGLCAGLKSIFIPGSVTDIKEGAFEGCTALESISVSKSNKNYHSSKNCLINTKEKTLIAGCKNSIIPNDESVNTIADSAFYECKDLKSITIPDSVTSIGEYAFNNCTGLISIKIPGSVTSIGKDAFGFCKNLTEVTIPESVTEIGEDAFSRCDNLIIKCTKDSYAYKYAQEHEIKKEIISKDNSVSLYNTDIISSEEDEDHFTVEQMSECLGKVCSVINSTNIVANKKGTISSLKKIIVTAAGIFYSSNSIDFDDEDVSIISDIVGGEIDGKAITTEYIEKAVSDARGWDPDEYFKSFEVRRTVGELVMMDKLAKADYGQGGTSMYNFIITDFLFVICEKHGIDFKSDDCCTEALDALEETIKTKWDSTFAF